MLLRKLTKELIEKCVHHFAEKRRVAGNHSFLLPETSYTKGTDSRMLDFWGNPSQNFRAFGKNVGLARGISIPLPGYLRGSAHTRVPFSTGGGLTPSSVLATKYRALYLCASMHPVLIKRTHL